jgi:hypothetical protein
VTTYDGPDHRKDVLPMATDHPTAWPLRTPERHRAFLSETFRLGHAAIAESLEHPDRLPDPDRQRREAGAYERLTEALRTGSIVPDPDVRGVVGELLDATDEANEFPRAFAEHAALVGLLDQLGGPR